ncbi:DEAD/DEAH box helicase [Bacillus suaedae]|uniref:DEAD/DEAH box helicase n=1 Tax=Halalkalibacter suaedae TaxID=2822140 RepID=A0A941ARA7_9BACI|nr:DEAD/DEAH box helicase [Bacillus suaedae]MBP3952258.1 DEAD/DEAH box helicase [Bacillus suaedae]
MRINVTDKMIKEMCGIVAFKKGDFFYRSNKVIINQHQHDFCSAIVKGTNDDFNVTIQEENDDIQSICSCPKLANFEKGCQHVAAVLIALRDLRKNLPTTHELQATQIDNRELTENFIMLFQENRKRTSGHQRYFEKRDILNVKFICKPVLYGKGQYVIGLEIEINGVRIQSLRSFLQAVKMGRAMTVSSNSNYDPNNHCFLVETDRVIHQLIEIVDDEKAFLNASLIASKQTLFIPPSSWERLLPILTEAPFSVFEHSGKLRVEEGPPPLEFKFEEREGGNYQLMIKGFDRMVVLPMYRSVIYEGTIFQLEDENCQRLFELKQMLASPSMTIISIPNQQIGLFLEKIVPGLKKLGTVQLANTLSQKLIKTPLVAKLYLDRLKNRLLAGLEFQYDHVIIQPLENRDIPTGPMLIRDLDLENEILELMESSGFSKTDGGYYMQNEALEYDFLYHKMPELQKMTQIYATTAVRNRIIKKNTHPKIRVKVKERTNWLEFKFEMDGIADKQIKEILEALEEKRKYYRLRNGALLSLETNEMKEIQRFLNAVPTQEEDFEGTLTIPVIESLRFIDSIEDSDIFKAEKSFQQFLDTVFNREHLSYEIPASLEHILRDYQKQGYQWMKMIASYGFGGVLADDMGLGKTLQSITFILSEISNIREKHQPVLIVCPSSLTYNWLNEIAKFAPDIQAIVIDGNQVQREALLNDSGDVDVIITSYPLLRRDSGIYEKRTFHTAFFDEAQAFKNPVTQTARAVKKIKANHYFGLTGTPVENSIEELWSIYYVVFPQLFQGLKEYSQLSRKDIATRVRPFLLRRVKEDVLAELPEKIESLESVDLFPEQKKLYAAYLAKLRHETLKHLDKDTLRKNRIKILAGLTRLRQICCHPALFVDGYNGSSAKFEQLLTILEESRLAGRRVLIFSQFTKMLDLIGREIHLRGQQYFYLDGQTPSKERVELCNRFNAGERDLFLISLKAGGTGLNLTGADTVILYDLWWNPAIEEQAADRAHRMGQENVVNVIKLVARGTIEEKMNILQEKKKDLVAEIIDAQEQVTTSLSEADIREILKV